MTRQSLRAQRSDVRSVLLVALLPALGDLLEQWVRARGLLAARVDHADRALDLVRRLPMLAAICDGRLLKARPEFSDRLHRAQVRAGLIVVLTDCPGGLGEGEALDRGAVDTLVAPGDRDRFGIAIERAMEWSQVSDLCVRRAITLSIERKLQALGRLSRRLSENAGVPPAELLPAGLSHLRSQLSAVLSTGLQPVEPGLGEAGVVGDVGRLPRTSLTVLADALAERAGRDLGLDRSWGPFSRDVALARVAGLWAPAWPPSTEALIAPLEERSRTDGDQSGAGASLPGAAA